VSDWQDLAQELGQSIVDSTKAELEDQWDGLKDDDKAILERTAKELAEMEAKKRLYGVEPDPERVALLKSTLLDYQVVGQISAYKVQSAFLKAAKEAAGVAGAFLAGFADELLDAIL